MRYGHNERRADTVNAKGIPESTLRTVTKEVDKIKEGCRTSGGMTASKIIQRRAPIVEKLERMPERWVEHQQQRAVRLSTVIIQDKANSLTTISLF
jgi:hypothetical protein